MFHDLPIGDHGANLDHLVIGAGGVFCINAKRSTGHVWVAERTLLVNGTKTDYLPNAVSEARRVSKRLTAACGTPVAVRPIIAVVTDALTIKAQPSDVTVVAADELVRHLTGLTARFTPQDAYEIVLAAHDPATWRGTESA